MNFNIFYLNFNGLNLYSSLFNFNSKTLNLKFCSFNNFNNLLFKKNIL